MDEQKNLKEREKELLDAELEDVAGGVIGIGGSKLTIPQKSEADRPAPVSRPERGL